MRASDGIFLGKRGYHGPADLISTWHLEGVWNIMFHKPGNFRVRGDVLR